MFTPWEGQGAAAIAEGLRAVRAGRADAALVGAADVRTHEFAFITLQQQGCFESWRRDGPEGSAEGSAGPVPGEGACFLLLEAASAARQRGARVYARIALAGWASRAGRAGLVATFSRAIAGAGSADAIVAAADGDRRFAQAEAAALARAGTVPFFGPFRKRGLSLSLDPTRGTVPISVKGCRNGDSPLTVRPKAVLGNLYAAAAPVQVAVAAELVRRGGGRRVLADCFGHGSEQAAFLLEAP